jgi:hypothetical protein
MAGICLGKDCVVGRAFPVAIADVLFQRQGYFSNSGNTEHQTKVVLSARVVYVPMALLELHLDVMVW